jgi:hypothetical protein
MTVAEMRSILRRAESVLTRWRATRPDAPVSDPDVPPPASEPDPDDPDATAPTPVEPEEQPDDTGAAVDQVLRDLRRLQTALGGAKSRLPWHEPDAPDDPDA